MLQLIFALTSAVSDNDPAIVVTMERGNYGNMAPRLQLFFHGHLLTTSFII